MGKIMYKNIPFAGGIKTDHVELTQLQYEALSTEEKNNPDKVYFVRDADPSEQTTLLDMMYPVGSYYETSDLNFDPNLEWGGVWIDESMTGRLYASGSVTVNASGYKDLASLTLPSNGRYMVFGFVYSSTGTSQVQMAYWKMTGTPTDWSSFYGRTTAQAGGGTHAVAYVYTGSSSVTLTLQCYGYNTSSHTETGVMMAVPLDKPLGKYYWHRIE